MTCYKRFHKIISVSKTVEMDFQKVLNELDHIKFYITLNESKKYVSFQTKILQLIWIKKILWNIIGVGKLLKSKGFDRVLRITKQLIAENYSVHTYILWRRA